MRTPYLIAHRGDRNNFPENTPEAFDSAFKKGADGVEMDVQLHNQKIIVVHDYSFNITKIYPELASVLEKFGQVGRLEIEVKSFTTDIIPYLQEAINTHKPKDIEITSSVLPLIPHLVSTFPNTNIGVIFDKCYYENWMTEELLIRKTINLMQLMHAKVAHIAHLPKEKLTPSLINTLHKEGLKFHYHIGKLTVEKQINLHHLLNNLQVDQYTFDDIELLSHLEINKTIK